MINWFRTWGRLLSLMLVLSDCTKAAFRHSSLLWFGGLLGLGIWLLSEHQKKLVDRCEELGQSLVARFESRWLMRDD